MVTERFFSLTTQAIRFLGDGLLFKEYDTQDISHERRAETSLDENT